LEVELIAEKIKISIYPIVKSNRLPYRLVFYQPIVERRHPLEGNIFNQMTSTSNHNHHREIHNFNNKELQQKKNYLSCHSSIYNNTKILNIATWNIQGKFFHSNAKEILSNDFHQRKIHIACLQETHSRHSEEKYEEHLTTHGIFISIQEQPKTS